MASPTLPALAQRASRQRYDYETSAPADAERYVRRLCAPYPPVVDWARDECKFRVTSIEVDRFRIQSIELSGSGRATIPASENVVVVQLLNGCLALETAAGPRVLNRGESHLLPARNAVSLQWDNVRVGLVTIDIAEIERIAADTGDLAASGVRFIGTRPHSPDAERYWQSAIRMINREVLPNEFASASASVQDSIGRWLAVALLQTFPNSAMTESEVGLSRTDDKLPPAALRRAVEYIQAHAGEPITMDDIAVAARVTTRSLQHGFRRTWDTTPTGYLRQVRLERAHHDLQAADVSAGATVAAIAAKWGFGNVGRFAARYRETYGHTPNEVLRS